MDIEKVLLCVLEEVGLENRFNAKKLTEFVEIDTLAECSTEHFMDIQELCDHFTSRYYLKTAARMWHNASKEERLGFLLAGLVRYVESEAY